MPLDVCGAKSQGLIGYMIQQSLRNELAKEGLNTPVVTVLTQVIVDENDPAFQNPTKPIGPFYTEEEAKRYAKERGETWKRRLRQRLAQGGASPLPVEIVEKFSISALIREGAVVIAAGGGGIPVIQKGNMLHGSKLVIDKDLASSKLQ